MNESEIIITVSVPPLWSDENIHNDAKRASSNPSIQAAIRSCMLFMRYGYEAERMQLLTRIAELEAAMPPAIYRTLMAALAIHRDECGTTPEEFAAREWLKMRAGKEAK